MVMLRMKNHFWPVFPLNSATLVRCCNHCWKDMGLCTVVFVFQLCESSLKYGQLDST